MPEFTEILIDECIKKHNRKYELTGKNKMTRIKLGREIYPELSDNVINTYLSNLSNGKKRCDVETIVNMSRILKVDIKELTPTE